MSQNNLDEYSNNLFSNHFLEERIQDLEEWESVNFDEKLDEFKQIYRENKGFLSSELNEDQTQSKFIDPVLSKLGHQWTPEARRKVGSRSDGNTLNPDYAFLGMERQLDIHEDEEKDYFDGSYALGDAKAWNRKLDKSSQDHSNPAFQIYNYVDRLRVDWGILTNGKKWRLYSYEKCAADIYFEIDLEAILKGEKTEEKLEAFKYFYLFFRKDSFKSEERPFLEKVYQESVNFAEGLEDDLEHKVYDALEVAVEGFFETNDIEKTPENIDLVHHASLIFLYRTLFILNAESRDLLPTDDEAYRQAFGLTQLKRMIVEEDDEGPLFHDTTVAWDNRLSRLFEGIDEGYELHEAEIPAYNGGLFDKENSDENQFLAENKLYGSYIKEILELLATKYDEEKEKRIIIDYKDLNIRHLGSVYEGLLEHQFKGAEERKVLENGEWKKFSETDKDWEEFEEEEKVEENELYLTNESGERKATGSYYTPEYIVEYIVENTVGPKVEEKIEEAEDKEENILPKVLELNVCDPAMGSGHFLTEATEFIAEHIVEHADLEEQEIDENEDELNWAKRQVVQNCIYGVDVNELAVELGKLSLWIETMAEEKPLNFLDHHLKHGNSLIGSDFDEIFSHPKEDQKRLDSDRYQFGDPQEIKENFQRQYLKVEEMPEKTVEQIHEKEKAYKEFISENVLYQQFQQLANIHTRQYFEEEANSSDYESFLINVGNPTNPFEDEEFFKNAQKDAENRNYFHWQLEFPKVFFGKQEGFDAVVGNPPWGADLEFEVLDKLYCSGVKRHNNTYTFFTERGIDLVKEGGYFGFITPNTWLEIDSCEKMRRMIYSISKELNLSLTWKIFPGLDGGPVVDTSTFFFRKDQQPNKKAISDGRYQDIEIQSNSQIVLRTLDRELSIEDKLNALNSRDWATKNTYQTEEVYGNFKAKIRIIESGSGGVSGQNLIEKIDNQSKSLEEDSLAEVRIGAQLYAEGQGDPPQTQKMIDEKVYNADSNESEDYKRFVPCGDVQRYRLGWSGEWVKYGENLHCPRREEIYNQDHILISRIFDKNSGRFKSCFVPSEDDFYVNNTDTFNILEKNSDFPLFYLLGVINSRLIGFYTLETNINLKRSAYPKINTNHAKRIPIPTKGVSEEKIETLEYKSQKMTENNSEFSEEKDSFLEWVEAEWGVDVDDLSLKTHLHEYWEYDFDEFMRVAKKNKSQIDGSVKSREFRELMKEEWESSMDTLNPLMQGIDELENEIDAIVFDLYDLTEEEVETVLDSIDTGEDEKKKILEKFANQ